MPLPVDAAPPQHPLLATGANPLTIASGGRATFEVDTVPGEHVELRVTFPTSTDGVELVVARGLDQLGTDGGGAGLRVLSVLDQGAASRYRVEVETGDALTGTLTVTRTPFQDGATCTGDCARLILLPVPNDPLVDGYDVTGAIKRYQFGRRDLVMFVRAAGRLRAGAGKAPFRPSDFSQWDGQIPGTDTGSLRHVSHQRGKDVDLSLYGLDGEAPWRSYCTVSYTSGGRVCQDGTVKNFDAYENARYFAPFIGSGRMTHGFLDAELIEKVKPAAVSAKDDGVIPTSILPLYSDGKHLQHWPNHDNHIHVRVSEVAYDQRVVIEDEPFEAP